MRKLFLTIPCLALVGLFFFSLSSNAFSSDDKDLVDAAEDIQTRQCKYNRILSFPVTPQEDQNNMHMRLAKCDIFKVYSQPRRIVDRESWVMAGVNVEHNKFRSISQKALRLKDSGIFTPRNLFPILIVIALMFIAYSIFLPPQLHPIGHTELMRLYNVLLLLRQNTSKNKKSNDLKQLARVLLTPRAQRVFSRYFSIRDQKLVKKYATELILGETISYGTLDLKNVDRLIRKCAKLLKIGIK